MRVLKPLGLITLLILILLLLSVLGKDPAAPRSWDSEFSRVTRAETSPDGAITLTNVRDWTYGGLYTVTSESWIDEVTVDPTAITRAWFLLDQFSEMEAIGHTFISFELADGRTIVLSIEARREVGEDYSAMGGLWNEYELQYLWGTERDFVTLRTVYLGHPVRMYPLSISATDAQALFRSFAAETNTLADHPRFYNTLTANCTNLLATIVNRYYPGSLPYDPAWNLPGYADRYLMEHGYISMRGTREDLQAAHDLSPYRAGILAHASTTPIAFSEYLRTLPPASE